MFTKPFIIFLILIILFSFDIEGSEIKREVGTIEFVGNNVFSDDYLIEKVAEDFKEKFDYDKIYDYLGKILNEYKALGYYNVRIDSLSPLRFRESVTGVKIYIYEGEKIKIKSVGFNGNNVISDDRLSKNFGISKGDYFIEKDIESGIEKIIKWYEENGYPFCKVEIEEKCFEDIGKTSEILLEFYINEGSPVKVDTIAVEGNNFTKKNLIIRESGLKEGEFFNQKLLNNVSNRFNKFEFVKLDGKPELITFKSSKNGILLKVIEKSSNYFSGILGYLPSRGSHNSSKGQFNGFIDIVFGNLFGTGRAVSVKWENRGGFSQDLNLKYSEPWFLNLPVNMSVFFNQSVEDSTFLKRGFAGEFNLPLFNNISGSLSFGYENTIPDKFGKSEYNISNSRMIYGKIGFDYDSRDDRLNPRKGIFYSTFYSIGKRNNLKDENLSGNSNLRECLDKKMTVDLQASIPTTKKGSIYSRIYGAQISSNEGEIPYSQLFTLGGTNSLRGYKEKQFRGSTVSLIELEYRYLLGEKSRIFLFYDGGYVKRSESKLIRTGYGWGFRISSRIGLIGFDYGIGEGDSPANGKIHFGLQSNF